MKVSSLIPGLMALATLVACAEKRVVPEVKVSAGVEYNTQTPGVSFIPAPPGFVVKCAKVTVDDAAGKAAPNSAACQPIFEPIAKGMGNDVSGPVAPSGRHFVPSPFGTAYPPVEVGGPAYAPAYAPPYVAPYVGGQIFIGPRPFYGQSIFPFRYRRGIYFGGRF